MSPAVSGTGLGRSRIEGWDIGHLESAARRWRASAAEFEDLFTQHRQNVGATAWEGTAKDAALDRVTADSAVVERHGEVVRAVADLADAGAADLRAAQRAALTAIGEAEADGFRVAEDLSVTDTRRIDIATMGARYSALNEHSENIRWNASQLVQADALVGQRLQEKATELDGMRFDGSTIQAASWGGFKQDGGADDDWEPPVIKTEQTPSHEPTVIDTKHEPPPEPEPKHEMFPKCDNTKVWLKIGQTTLGGLTILGGALSTPFTFGGGVLVIGSGLLGAADGIYEIWKCG
ncbi:hypothetical protein ABQE62_05460 [Mycolicibacterium fortuitum]